MGYTDFNYGYNSVLILEEGRIPNRIKGTITEAGAEYRNTYRGFELYGKAAINMAGDFEGNYLKGAASYALDHHVTRLEQDHQLMSHLAQGLAGIPGLQIETPQTNILFVDLVGEAKSRGAALQAHLKSEGIDMTGLYRLRFVTHLDVDRAGVDRAIAAIRQFFGA